MSKRVLNYVGREFDANFGRSLQFRINKSRYWNRQHFDIWRDHKGARSILVKNRWWRWFDRRCFWLSGIISWSNSRRIWRITWRRQRQKTFSKSTVENICLVLNTKVTKHTHTDTHTHTHTRKIKIATETPIKIWSEPRSQ